MKFLKPLLFNFFTRGYIKQASHISFLGRRFSSMIVDMFFVVSVLFPFVLIIMVPVMIFDIGNSGIKTHANSIDYINIIPFSIIIFFLLNKDFYNSRSVAKRIFGYQIFDLKTNTKANSMQCAVRNLTAFIWPIEAIILLFNPCRRLGDFIAGTILVDADSEIPESILDDIKEAGNYKNLAKTITLSIAFTLLLDLIATLPMSNYYF